VTGDVDPRAILHDAIAATAPDIDPAGAICTGWVVVTEWVDSTGRYQLSRVCSAETPRWRGIGLLDEAADHWRSQRRG